MRASDLRRLLPQAEAFFSEHPDVTAVGIGERFKDQKPVGHYAIIVSVEQKGNARGDPIPATLEFDGIEVPTDVRSTPRAAFQTANAKLDGSDLLISSGVGRTGTLGLVAPERGGTGRVFGITCAHVVSGPDEDRTGDEVKAVIQGSQRTIGSVAYQSSFRSGADNTVDLALIALNAYGRSVARKFTIQVFSGAVKEAGTLGFSRFTGALRPHAYGGSTTTSRHKVDCQALVEHRQIDIRDLRSGKAIRFGRAFGLSAASPGVRGGHSGALLVRKRNDGHLVATGLLAAGRGSSAFAFSMTDIDAELRRAGIGLA